MWIEFLARKLAASQQTVRLATPSQYLDEYPTNQMALPSASSWGSKGYGEVWLEGSNDWLYRHLHTAGRRMHEIARAHARSKKNDNGKLLRRALNQAARELVLAESSDWPFIMKSGTMVQYAEKRFGLHINRFTQLYESISSGAIDAQWLREVESRDNIFADLDCAAYYR
jgi:1,4-alpha-glucan branching enzyme